MEGLVLETDLVSFAGLAILLPLLVGGIKHLFPAWTKGKEPVLALILSYSLGITSKLTIPGAFDGVGWLTIFVGLFFVAVAAMTVHDSITNPILKAKNGK